MPSLLPSFNSSAADGKLKTTAAALLLGKKGGIGGRALLLTILEELGKRELEFTKSGLEEDRQKNRLANTLLISSTFFVFFHSYWA